MIEIILLYFLTKSIGATATRKGLPAGRWKLITILAWLSFEMIGLTIGIAFLGTGDLLGLMVFGLACAFGGYLTVRYNLDKRPGNKINDDIDNIGRS